MNESEAVAIRSLLARADIEFGADDFVTWQLIIDRYLDQLAELARLPVDVEPAIGFLAGWDDDATESL